MNKESIKDKIQGICVYMRYVNSLKKQLEEEGVHIISVDTTTQFIDSDAKIFVDESAFLKIASIMDMDIKSSREGSWYGMIDKTEISTLVSFGGDEL